MDPISETICPTCHLLVPPNSYFCPNCGKPIISKPLEVSLWAQIVAYSVAIFLPPFGYWTAAKYLKQSDDTSKRIGLIVIILTTISIIAAVWFTVDAVNSASQMVNNLNVTGY